MKTTVKDRKDTITLYSNEDELLAHEFFVGSYNGWLVAVQSVEVEYSTDFAPTYRPEDGPVYRVNVKLHGTKVNKGLKLGQTTLSATVYASSLDRVRTEAPAWAINLLSANRPQWWNGDLGGMFTRKPLDVHEVAEGKIMVWMKP